MPKEKIKQEQLENINGGCDQIKDPGKLIDRLDGKDETGEVIL